MLLMTFSDEMFSIDTPENVVFGYEVAGIGSRFLAALVDTILIVLLQTIVLLTLFFAVKGLFVEVDVNVVSWIVAGAGLISFALLWGYYIFFELLWNGQSPGKRWVGLRVIRVDGTPLTASEAIIRNLVRLVDFLPAYYGLGVVVMFINDQSRRLGDLAAGTLVVRDRATVTLEGLNDDSTARDAPLLFSAGANVAFPVERLSEADVRLAENFLHRRYELANREQLARQILRALLRQMSLAVDPPGQRPEAVIQEIVGAWQRSAETKED